ncbi:MAG: hypothetical protein R3B45_02565 [Bdellovibrionota bacterium]
MHIITASAPTRIDLAGGTIDLWPIHCSLNHCATVNVAITLPATVTIEQSNSKTFEFHCLDLNKHESGTYQDLCQSKNLPLFALLLSHYWSPTLPAIKITSLAKSPAGAGIGGSSCLTVVMGSALWQAKSIVQGIKTPEFSEHQLVQTSRDIEARLIFSPTGCQDYWAAIRGSINIIKYPLGHTQVNTIQADQIASPLNEQLILCYSGKSRDSAINNWEVFKKFYNKDQEIYNKLDKIGQLAEKCALALQNNDIETALIFSKEEWALRRKIWPTIETDETKKIDQAAIRAGAVFSRVCGAGGGGVMAIFAKKELREDICREISLAGGEVLPAEMARNGIQLSKERPN